MHEENIYRQQQTLINNRPTKGIAMFTWMPIEGLPHPPQHFIDRAITIANEGKEKHKNITTGYYPGGAETHVDRTVVLEGEEYSSRYQVGYEIGEDFDQWVRDHIVEDFVNATVRRSEGKSPLHGAHIDNSRRWAIWYMIERGGEDSRTRFYKLPGHETEWPLEHRVFNNMDDLVEFDAVKWPMNQWFVINTSIIHAITDVHGPRTSIQIGTMDLPFKFK
jgi:hypothetical protein